MGKEDFLGQAGAAPMYLYALPLLRQGGEPLPTKADQLLGEGAQIRPRL
ncbi:MAG: hypothetical protein LAP86_24395 [Acidobacteriia bacterium]|nr:hypothetical protein [Terriglobia bacterium]